MSFMIESRQTNEINNKDREQFLSFKMKEDYSFKVLFICITYKIYIIRTVLNT